MKFKPTHKAGALVVEIGPKEGQFPLPASEHMPTALPVFRLERILVPVDFSEASAKALVYAAAFASQFQAELTLLHVVQPYPPVPQMGPVDMESMQEATEKLLALRTTLGVTMTSHTVLRTGDPPSEIIQAARDLSSDLIILSTHGRTGLAHALLGSTTEKVARHAGCPILIVRELEHDFIGGPEKVQTTRA